MLKLKLRKKPMLSNEAYPTIFPNLRQCSSEAASKQRTNPKDRRAVIAERDEEVSGGSRDDNTILCIRPTSLNDCRCASLNLRLHFALN